MKDAKNVEVCKFPSDWKMFEIRDIGEVVTGTTPPTKVKEYWGNGYLFITPTDFSKSKYVLRTERTVTQKGIEKARVIPKDSVMVTCIASIGEIAMSPEACITNQQINAIICSKKANPHYIYYAIGFRKNLLKRWAGITTSPIIKKSFFEKFQLPLPPLSEQKGIAEVLSTVDESIEKITTAIDKTEKLKRGLMQRLFTRGIGHKEFNDTEIGRIPRNWDIVKLDEALTLCQYGLSLKIGDQGKYQILKMDDIANGYVLPKKAGFVDLDEDIFKKFKLEKGDILFNRTNSFELVGRTGIFQLQGDYVFASYLIRLRTNRNLIEPLFLMFYFTHAADKIRQLATRAVHQANINATNLQKIIIPLPPIFEQQKISQIFSSIDNRLELLKKKQEKMEKVKKGLINDLLTGQRRVRI